MLNSFADPFDFPLDRPEITEADAAKQRIADRLLARSIQELEHNN